jgi:hypothetical protein
LALTLLISFTPRFRHPGLSIVLKERMWGRTADLSPPPTRLSSEDQPVQMLKESQAVFRRKPLGSSDEFV